MYQINKCDTSYKCTKDPKSHDYRNRYIKDTWQNPKSFHD